MNDANIMNINVRVDVCIASERREVSYLESQNYITYNIYLRLRVAQENQYKDGSYGSSIIRNAMFVGHNVTVDFYVAYNVWVGAGPSTIIGDSYYSVSEPKTFTTSKFLGQEVRIMTIPQGEYPSLTYADGSVERLPYKASSVRLRIDKTKGNLVLEPIQYQLDGFNYPTK